MARANVPLNTPTEQPTRRALLGTMAAAGIVGAAHAVVMAGGGDVDPHAAWEDQANALLARVDAESMSDAESDAVMAEVYKLEDLIGTTRTRTLAGAMVQLRLVQNYIDLAQGISSSGRDLVAMASALCTLEMFGIGRGRA